MHRQTPRRKIRFGIIGLGLMGREVASAFARWCHLLDDSPVPVLSGICDRRRETWQWYLDNFSGIATATDDYRELLAAPDIDAIYCAVPHNLHQSFYLDVMRAGKHLLGEKPFGIDLSANAAICDEASRHPELIVRCTSEFPYYPAVRRIVGWLNERRYGRIIEVRTGFNHCSDLDPDKPINWKRRVATNGEYGCLGDLGMHTHHLPLRMGWVPQTVFADLQKIVTQRPDGSGSMAPCDTWDNAVLHCSCIDKNNGALFSMQLETKRMEPGSTNRWFIEILGTRESARFSTQEPRTIYFCRTEGAEQGWTRIDIGADSFVKTITGPIFETGFSDAILQMLAAYLQEFREGGSHHAFPNASLEETRLSHAIMSAALCSHRRKAAVAVDTCR